MGDFTVVERAGTQLVDFNEAPEDAWDVYIGRENAHYGLPQSQFANPFPLNDFSRQEAVDLYKLWFYHQIRTDDEFEAAAQDLQGHTLACWCVPDACHGEVILQWLDREEIPRDEVAFICARLQPRTITTSDRDVDTALSAMADWVE